MSIHYLSPVDAFAMLAHGAKLIDIRDADEWRREHIAEALHHPLANLSEIPPLGESPIIFHCRSGNRTRLNAGRLAAAVRHSGTRVYILDGGIEAWKDSALPTIQDKRQPIELMRQVQIAVGSLVAIGTALGMWLDPLFLSIPAFVGLGLTVAGATGYCGMAKLLALAPWNHRAI